MTAPTAENQAPAQVTEQKPSDKELNYRKLEARYQAQLEQERQGRLDAEKKAQELSERQKQPQHEEEEEDDNDPYVEKKKFKKELQKVSQKTKQETLSDVQKAIQDAKLEAKREAWLDLNPDCEEVLEKYVDEFAIKAPALAKSFMNMPKSFERQQAVYHAIKELGLDKPKMKEKSVQDKIDENRRSPYYQPSNIGNAPYAGPQGDFSKAGQKAAYEKMQELKRRIQG